MGFEELFKQNDTKRIFWDIPDDHENSWWIWWAIRIYLKTKQWEDEGMNMNNSGTFSIVSYWSLSKDVAKAGIMNNTSMGKKGSLKKEGFL